MTKKDYVLIASGIRTAIEGQKNGITDNKDYMKPEQLEKYSIAIYGIKIAVYELSERLRNKNGKFDVLKFYLACGLTEQDFMKDYIPL